MGRPMTTPTNEIEGRLSTIHKRMRQEQGAHYYEHDFSLYDIVYLLNENNARLELLAELMIEQIRNQEGIIEAIEWDR